MWDGIYNIYLDVEVHEKWQVFTTALKNLTLLLLVKKVQSLFVPWLIVMSMVPIHYLRSQNYFYKVCN